MADFVGDDDDDDTSDVALLLVFGRNPGCCGGTGGVGRRTTGGTRLGMVDWFGDRGPLPPSNKLFLLLLLFLLRGETIDEATWFWTPFPLGFVSTTAAADCRFLNGAVKSERPISFLGLAPCCGCFWGGEEIRCWCMMAVV